MPQPQPFRPIRRPPGSAAEGEMARRVREFDWASTPLGPMDQWPIALSTAVGICLNSRFPMFIWWGRELIHIYNDAYIPTLGKRHPASLGHPAPMTWADVWPVVGPQTDAVLYRGEATWNERVLLTMERNGYVEDTYHTWSYSPIPDGVGGIGGVFCACTEDTAQVLADRDAQELANQRQVALDAARMGWWHFDPRTGVADWDDRYAEIFGIEGHSIDNAEILKRIHPDDVNAVLDAVGAALDPNDPRQYVAEYRVRRDDGTTCWVEAHGVAEFRGTGPQRRAVNFVGTVADITDRKVADELLRTSEDRLALAVGAGELGTFYCPMPLGEIVWNAKCMEHFWLPPDTKIDFDLFYSILHPDDRERTRKAVEQAVFDRRGYDIEYRTVAPDGRERWVRAKGRAYYDASGEPTRFDGITLDITEQKRLDFEIRDREARFRHLADAVPQIVWVANAEGVPEHFNRRWYKYTGLSDIKATPNYRLEVLDDAGRKIVKDAWAKALLDRSPFEAEYQLRRADGVLRWHLGRAEPIFDVNGTLKHWFGTATDIDDRKRVEEEKRVLLESERAARAEADRASRMKDEFLATLSHELRTPLNAILGWSQIIKRGSATAADVKQGVEVIERNARAQAQIIEDLLEMSRVISGKVRLDVKPLDLRDLVIHACATAQPTADARAIRLACDRVESIAFKGDPNRLQQVLWNLISNAIKFTPRGGSVNVELIRTTSHAQIRVIDTGEGIRPEFLPHVFERFRQADASTTRRFGGLGLGLSIVKQLAELHGGSVQAFSAGENTGATFVVTLPLVGEAAEVQSDLSGQSKIDIPKATASLRSMVGLRLLVVDDEADARMLVRRLLEECDATVVTAASAEEAFALMTGQSFDVLVSDIGMPGEDGHSLIRRIRGLPADAGGKIPAIALTAYAREEDRNKALSAGFQRHIAKPVDPAELVAAVDSLSPRKVAQ